MQNHDFFYLNNNLSIVVRTPNILCNIIPNINNPIDILIYLFKLNLSYNNVIIYAKINTNITSIIATL